MIYPFLIGQTRYTELHARRSAIYAYKKNIHPGSRVHGVTKVRETINKRVYESEAL